MLVSPPAGPRSHSSSAIFFSISLPHSSFCSIYSALERVRLTPGPRVLNWGMEIDSLKYLLWNLLCNDNSRPFPCKESSQFRLNFQKLKKKTKPLKLFLQLLKCKWSMTGSPMYSKQMPEYLWARNLGKLPVVRSSNGVLPNCREVPWRETDELLLLRSSP